MFDINPPSSEALELLGHLVIAFWVLMVAAAVSAVLLAILFVGWLNERFTATLQRKVPPVRPRQMGR